MVNGRGKKGGDGKWVGEELTREKKAPRKASEKEQDEGEKREKKG